MSALFNQTNIAPGTSFSGSGGGGGSNFVGISTGAITVSSITFPQGSYAFAPKIGTVFSGDLSIPITGNYCWFNAPGTTCNATMIDPNGIWNASPQNVWRWSSKDNYKTSLSNISTILVDRVQQQYLTNATCNYVPIEFSNLTSLAANGGGVAARFTYDTADTGALNTCVVGANGGGAFIGAEWPGFITMPFRVYGATITLESDNETFFYLDGAAGAIGTISTGVGLLSSSNAFSSIVAPAGQKANMSALFSTLSNVYPACFS